MGEIVGSIQRVSDIVAEITSASAEQSAGVQQVGDAVSQMDQATQQNAALVEQSAAAAESLKSQAQHLAQAVAVFKLTHAGDHATAGFAA
jgi:methyl-accepting chemotaxis protein